MVLYSALLIALKRYLRVFYRRMAGGGRVGVGGWGWERGGVCGGYAVMA